MADICLRVLLSAVNILMNYKLGKTKYRAY